MQFASHDPEFARALDVASAREVAERSEAWRPWRAYAAMYFWRFGAGIAAHEDASAIKKTDTDSAATTPYRSVGA